MDWTVTTPLRRVQALALVSIGQNLPRLRAGVVRGVRRTDRASRRPRGPATRRRRIRRLGLYPLPGHTILDLRRLIASRDGSRLPHAPHRVPYTGVEMGMRKRKPWTTHDREVIESLAADRSWREIGALLGRSKKSVANYALRCGISRGGAQHAVATPTLEGLRQRCHVSDLGCWEWQGKVETSGYGRMQLNGNNIAVHRLTYELSKGPIPEGLQIDHLCRNRRCCNPAHLEAVTPRENVRRGVSKVARQMGQTCCIRGHKFSPENSRIGRSGKRQCRVCQRMRENSRSLALRQELRTP